MTENEKAATFIGEVCDGEIVYVRTQSRFKCKKCKREDCARADWVHHVPDMSLPENFWKAAQKVYRDVLFVEDNPQMTAFLRDKLMSALEAAIYEDDASTTIVAFLAGLYDEIEQDARQCTRTVREVK